MNKFAHLKIATDFNNWGLMADHEERSFRFLENLRKRDGTHGQLKQAGKMSNIAGEAASGALGGAMIGGGLGALVDASRQARENQKNPKKRKSLADAALVGLGRGAKGGAVGGALIGGGYGAVKRASLGRAGGIMGAATGGISGAGIGAAANTIRQAYKNKKDPENKKSLLGAAAKGGAVGGAVGGAAGGLQGYATGKATDSMAKSMNFGSDKLPSAKKALPNHRRF